MLFDSKPKIGINAKISINEITPSTISIFGTAQMIEARKSSYIGFNLADLKMQASRILKNQMYIIYHLGLTRFMMQHAVGANFVKKNYFEITPESFTPTNEEISLYLSNPKFLWRFSAWNYNAMIQMFDPKHRSKNFTHSFKTYKEDDSPVMSYVESRNTRIINNLKLNFKKLDSIKYEPYNHEKFETVQSYFTYRLNKYEQTEIYFSDDYYLHELDAETTYDEYIHLLITGDCRRYPSDLLLQQIDVKNDNLNKIKSKTFFKKVNKRLSKSSCFSSVLKYMSAKVEKSDPLIIPKLADLVAFNKKYVTINNPLITNPRWLNECYLEFLTPMSVFYWFINGIFDNDHIISENSDSAIGVPWDIDIESNKKKWLLKQFSKVTVGYKWLYDVSLRESKETDMSQETKKLNQELIHLINLYIKVALSIDTKQFPSPKKLKCFESYNSSTQRSYVSSSSVYSSIRSAGSKTLSLRRLFVQKDEVGPIHLSELDNCFKKKEKPNFNNDDTTFDVLTTTELNLPVRTLESLATTTFQLKLKKSCNTDYDENSKNQLSRSTTRKSTKGFQLELCDIKEEVDEDFSVELDTACAQEHLPPSAHIIKDNFASVYKFSNKKVVKYKANILNKLIVLRNLDEKENLPIIPTCPVIKKQQDVPDSYVHPSIIASVRKHVDFPHPTLELLSQGDINAWKKLSYVDSIVIVIDLLFRDSPNCLNTKPLIPLIFKNYGRSWLYSHIYDLAHEYIIYKLNNRYETMKAAIDSTMKKFTLTRDFKNFPDDPKFSAKLNMPTFTKGVEGHTQVCNYLVDYYLAHHPDMRFIRDLLLTVLVLLGSSESMKELAYVIARDIYLSEGFDKCKYFTQNTNWSYELFNFDESNQEIYDAVQTFEFGNEISSELESTCSEESLENNLSINSS